MKAQIQKARQIFLGLVWKRNFPGCIARFWAKLRWHKLGDIPQEQIIWRSVYNSHQIKPSGELKSSFFKSSDLSCDAAILTNKEDARRGLHEPRRPENAGLVGFKVQDVVDICGEGISHRPLITLERRKHYSHCEFKKTLTSGQAKRMKGKTIFVVTPTFEVPDDDIR